MHSSPRSLPPQMAGFLAGDTIHVHGEAGNIRFSGQFQIVNPNQSPSSTTPGVESPEENQSSPIPGFSAATPLSCTTQNHQPRDAASDLNNRPVELPDRLEKPEYDAMPAELDRNYNEEPQEANIFSTPEKPDTLRAISTPDRCDPSTPPSTATQQIKFPVAVETRLRSGKIRRINYFPPTKGGLADRESGGSSSVPVRSPRTITTRRTGDAAERVLRRHDLPIRPCNAYTFFVIANWERIKVNSFQETSRRLADLWRELPDRDKSEYEELGWKDRERYKRVRVAEEKVCAANGFAWIPETSRGLKVALFRLRHAPPFISIASAISALHSTLTYRPPLFFPAHFLLRRYFVSLSLSLSSSMDSGYALTVRRPGMGEDEGLASFGDMEAGFSGKHPLRSASYDRRQTYRALSSSSAMGSQTPRSAFFYGARGDEPHHFLEACFMCKKPIGENRDIFMYRGDTPFCSEECRQEQIEIDEAKEKNWNLAKKVPSRKENQKSTSKNQNYHARAGGDVVVAVSPGLSLWYPTAVDNESAHNCSCN
ncbi:hypothetical protein H6P81_005392 [Aristolochia fimbriata]|uniref:FLZ-type domain-containing protein n=1 Tax=Aristolochia fimbriata TaxID=158543 RepID=A0AAV7EUV4_ARIFI|nr:hypothetical protein H6P81_005392 [Aristolochia fimbriata]